MSAIWKRSKKVINVNFCVPNCGHFPTNWLNFCPQLGYSRGKGGKESKISSIAIEVRKQKFCKLSSETLMPDTHTAKLENNTNWLKKHRFTFLRSLINIVFDFLLFSFLLLHDNVHTQEFSIHIFCFIFQSMIDRYN